MPFLFRSIEHMQKVLDGPIGDEILEQFRAARLRRPGLLRFRRALDLQQRPAGPLARRPQGTADPRAAIRADGRDDPRARRRAGRVAIWPGARPGSATKLIDGAENNWPSFVTTDHYKHRRLLHADRAHDEPRSAGDVAQGLGEPVGRRTRRSFARRRCDPASSCARSGATSRSSRASRRRTPASPSSTDIDRKPFEAAMAGIYAKARRDPAAAATDRTHSQGASELTSRRTQQRCRRNARRASPRAPVSGIVQLVRAVPIRWRILSIAALNSAVVLVLAALIWNGAKVLGSAWDDVRQVRESDKILALLESETGRLQNLIHRYINQPSPELFAEILLLREAVLGTLTTRAATDPMLSGSVEELERVTEPIPRRLRRTARACRRPSPRPMRSRCWRRRKRHGRALFHHRRRHRPSRRADLALARQVARGLHRDAGRRQRLLSVAGHRRRPKTPAATPRRSRRPSR